LTTTTVTKDNMNARIYGRDGSAKLGSDAEIAFEKFMSGRGWKLTHANRKQDMFEHWDYLIEKEGHSLKVEVKSAKKFGRGDAEVQYEEIWVELQNVRGNLGWLFGKADYVAFQLEDKFALIQRSKLEEVTLDKLIDKQVTSAAAALYHKYTRRGRNDLVTRIRYDDIKEFCKEL
jgi:hypothetical protein